MEQSQANAAAQILCDARRNRQRIDCLPPACRPQNIGDGYQIQDALINLIGGSFHTWKVGSTSKKAQDLVGTTHPIAARLLDDIVWMQPDSLPADRFFMRALEAEFAFSLRHALPAGEQPFSMDRVASAIGKLYPAVEISDSRYHDWSVVGGPSLLADNSNDGGLVLGRPSEDWRGLDLPAQVVTLYVNDNAVARGKGADVLGNPVAALAWLADDRAARGDGLAAGQIVTTGSCTGVFMANAGDRVRADYGPFGSVSFSFT